MKQKILKTLMAASAALVLSIPLEAQKGEYARLKTGDMIPSYTFNFVRHFPRSNINTTEFRGKWFVLAFWNSHCSVCLKKMPQEDSLQKEFAAKVQFLLVGYTGSQYSRVKGPDHERVQELYEQMKQRLNISLPVAYDSTLFHKMDITACPYLVIVDPGGIIQGITSSISSKELGALVNNEKVVLRRAYRQWELKEEKATAL